MFLLLSNAWSYFSQRYQITTPLCSFSHTFTLSFGADILKFSLSLSLHFRLTPWAYSLTSFLALWGSYHSISISQTDYTFNWTIVCSSSQSLHIPGLQFQYAQPYSGFHTQLFIPPSLIHNLFHLDVDSSSLNLSLLFTICTISISLSILSFTIYFSFVVLESLIFTPRLFNSLPTLLHLHQILHTHFRNPSLNQL